MVSKWNATSVHEPTIQPKDIFYISINTPSVSIGTDMSLMMISTWGTFSIHIMLLSLVRTDGERKSPLIVIAPSMTGDGSKSIPTTLPVSPTLESATWVQLPGEKP
jgi:hypothetical protein